MRGHRLSQGCGWNASTQGFSTAFTRRRNSCVYDSQGLGYWSEAFYAARGTYSSLGVIPGLSSIMMCAQRCSTTAGCFAFQWSTGCTLVGGSFTDFCDLQQPGCTASYGPIGFYSADLSNIYCSQLAEDCTCSREYYFCMRGSGCFSNSSDLQDFANVCVSAGCTAAQCGLPQVFCNTSNTCSADFLACNAPYSSVASESYKCNCIKDFTSCLSSAGCLSTVDSASSSVSTSQISSPIPQVPVSLIQSW